MKISTKQYFELGMLIYMLPAALMGIGGGAASHLLGSFTMAYMGGLIPCLIGIVLLSRDEEYRPHSLFILTQQERDQLREDEIRPKIETSPTERQNKLSQNCSTEGCNALTFRFTDHCWRHQDEPPSDPDLDQAVDSWVPEPEPEVEGNWWEEQTE